MTAASRSDLIPSAPLPDPNQQLYQALAQFQGSAPAVQKDAVNPHFRSQYATLASVIEALRGAAACGLSHSQTFDHNPDGQTILVTTVYHVGGGSLRSFLPISFAADWQKNGSAITYARRYALLAAFGLAPADDDDGANAAPAPVRSQQRPTAPAARPRDDRALTIKQARNRLVEAGLTAAGAQHMIAELAPPGVARLDDMPVEILRRLATTGASDAEISRWNAGNDAADSDAEQMPLADPQVLATMAGSAA